MNKRICLFLCLVLAIIPVTAKTVKDIHKQQALQYLKENILEASRNNAHAVEKIMKHYTDHSGIQFTIDYGQSVFPDSGGGIFMDPVILSRPPQVALLDWNRFLQFWTPERAASFYSERGYFNFTLIDLNEDGQRDLVLDTYVGGTGLFSETTLYRYDREQGFVPVAPRTEENDVGFSINGRGGDQGIYLLKLNGKSYLAYRDSVYGTLYRPLSATNAKETEEHLQIAYTYQHQLALSEEEAQTEKMVAPNMLGAIDQYFNNKSKRTVYKKYRIGTNKDHCLLPKGKEVDEVWPWYGSGHYTYEMPVSFPVQTPTTCYNATIISYLGSGSISSGYENCCELALNDQYFGDKARIPLTSKRYLIKAKIKKGSPQMEKYR